MSSVVPVERCQWRWKTFVSMKNGCVLSRDFCNWPECAKTDAQHECTRCHFATYCDPSHQEQDSQRHAPFCHLVTDEWRGYCETMMALLNNAHHMWGAMLFHVERNSGVLCMGFENPATLRGFLMIQINPKGGDAQASMRARRTFDVCIDQRGFYFEEPEEIFILALMRRSPTDRFAIIRVHGEPMVEFYLRFSIEGIKIEIARMILQGFAPKPAAAKAAPMADTSNASN